MTTKMKITRDDDDDLDPLRGIINGALLGAVIWTLVWWLV